MTFCSDEQPGGIARIEFKLLTETANWPVVVTDVTAGQVLFNPEANFIEGIIVPDTFNINDKPKDSANGQLWPNDISFTYLYRGAAMEQLLEQYANKPGVTFVWFNDRSVKLYGTFQEPIYLTWENDYGRRMNDNHGVTIKIAGNTSHRPVYYTPVL
jgi:hypothetical protein